MNIVHHQRRSRIPEEDRCNECDENAIQEGCDKCGEGVCMTSSCCELFPHYNNSQYVICRHCTNSIDKKLRVLINHSELRLLKQKINKRMEKKIKQLNDIVIEQLKERLKQMNE